MQRSQQSGGFQVAEFTPELAKQIPDLVYRCFGYTYTQPRLYEPALIVSDVAEGRLDPVICVDENGAPRGMVALEFWLPSRQIAEINKMMVDPEAEVLGGAILKRMLEGLRDRMQSLSQHRDLRTVFSLDVTNHKLTQRLVREMGFVTGGLFLGNAPAWHSQFQVTPQERLETAKAAPVPGGGTAFGRTTEVVSVRPFRSRTPAQVLSPPGRFSRLVADIYKDYRLQFEMVPGQPPEGETLIEPSLDFNSGYAVLEVRNVGSDAAHAIRELTRHFHEGFIELVRVVLPLSGIDLNAVVEDLGASGFAFAAVLPQYRESPVLILQYIEARHLAPIPNGLLRPRATRILEEIGGTNGAAAEDAPGRTSLRPWMLRQ